MPGQVDGRTVAFQTPVGRTRVRACFTATIGPDSTTLHGTWHVALTGAVKGGQFTATKHTTAGSRVSGGTAGARTATSGDELAVSMERLGDFFPNRLHDAELVSVLVGYARREVAICANVDMSSPVDLSGAPDLCIDPRDYCFATGNSFSSSLQAAQSTAVNFRE